MARTMSWAAAALAAAAVAPALRAQPTTAFTYQGELRFNGGLVDTSADVRITLFDAPAAGSAVGGPITQTVPVIDGVFSAPFDFGVDLFDAPNLWMAVEVRTPSGVGAFVPLRTRLEQIEREQAAVRE